MSPPAILDLLRLPLFAFGVPPSCLATLRFATIHVRPCALSPFSFKRSKLLLSLRRFSLSPALPSTLYVSTPFGSIVPIILDLLATLRFAAIHPLQKISHQFFFFSSDPSARRHRPRLAPLPLDSGASHAPIGGSIQQSYCTQSYHALSSVISRRSSLNTPELRAAIMWRRCDHDRREYRPHRHQGVGRGINPLRGQTFCPREDNTSLIVNCQSSIVNRQSSIINRLSPVVERLIPVLAAVGSIP